MAKADTDTVYVAITSGTATIKGEQIAFNKDRTLIRSGHPLLEWCPTYFVPFGGEFLDWPPRR
jgi:hypothetical protein